MPSYNILVADPFRSQYDWAAFCTSLERVFAPVIAESADFDSCTAAHHTADPVSRDFNLVLYMVPDRSLSMISRHFGVSLPANHAGHTYTIEGGESVSEVYYRVETNSSRRPYLAYHEAMHNILRRGNALHNRHGLAEHVPDPTDRRHANDVLMGRQLRNTPPQWFGGFAIARNLERALDGL